ncbi:glycosyltransferase family 2 protein [Pseudoalteromonas ruthenica]|uniref:glycosyltransferase family 2 protein n=1 Tax=Pseudoalteromonas ruthenica TaxID=151081 RepID=UPI000344E45F|nr:glycosyltransferase [Pseudoalteromonas ruthenica]
MNLNLNDSPLVSVYIPTRNRADVLSRALHSVLCQTYQNIEVLVVDDGSTDGTQELMKQFTDQFSRVKYFRCEKSGGAPAARNFAINKAQGELVTGLDDDDYFLPDRIQVLLDNYDPHYAFICSGYYWKYGRYKAKLHSRAKIISLSDELHYNQASNQVLVSRSRLLEVGLFDETFVSCQDWDLWVRLIARYGPAKRISRVDYVIDTSHGGHRITDNPNRAKGFEQFLKKHNCLMSKSHRKSIYFQKVIASGEKLALPKLISISTWPLFTRNLKYWLSSKFPNIAKKRLDSKR